VPAHSAALGVPTGGIVAEVLVSEGDQVQAGQALLRLDQARAEATIAQAEAELAQAQAAYAKLQGSATPEDIAAAEAALRAAQAQLRQTTGSVTEADRAAAQAQLQQARAHLAALQAGPKRADLQSATAALAQAQATLTTQRDQLSAAKTNAQIQLERVTSDLTQAQARYSTAQQNWQYVQDTGRDPVTPWLGTDPKSGKKISNTLSDAQRQQYYDAYVQAEAAMHSAEAAVHQAQVAADAAQQGEVSGIQVAEQQVASAQANLDKLRSGAGADDLAAARAAVASSQAVLDKQIGDQRTGALDTAQAAVDQAQANLAKLRAGTSKSDLAVAAADVQRAQAALKLAQVAVDEAVLRAPFAGTVGALDARVGEYVQPGAPVVQLADLAAWQIETTDLTEQNIVRVHTGSQASVSIDALPDLDLHGTVSRIRPLGENKQGDITYAVTIKLDQQDPQLRWNMTATVALEE
jgi:HlyD family secretion protein